MTTSEIAVLLRRLEHDPRWHATTVALTRLAEHLTAHEPPIDYARRRRLDYTRLLPADVWKRIARRTHLPPDQGARVVLAQGWLFERLSGASADLAQAPFVIRSMGIGHNWRNSSSS